MPTNVTNVPQNTDIRPSLFDCCRMFLFIALFKGQKDRGFAGIFTVRSSFIHYHRPFRRAGHRWHRLDLFGSSTVVVSDLWPSRCGRGQTLARERTFTYVKWNCRTDILAREIWSLQNCRWRWMTDTVTSATFAFSVRCYICQSAKICEQEITIIQEWWDSFMKTLMIEKILHRHICL